MSTAAVSRFDADTAIGADVSTAWSVGPVPNGGYLASLALRRLGTEAGAPDPVSLSVAFARPAEPGPVIYVVTATLGRRVVSAVLRQRQRNMLHATASFGVLDEGERDGHWVAMSVSREPALAAYSSSGSTMPDGTRVSLAESLDLRLDPALTGWLHGKPRPAGARPRSAAFVRFADGREPDVWSLPLFADCLPPTVWSVGRIGHVPTLSSQFHFYRHPSPGWLYVSAETNAVVGRHFDQHVRVWDGLDRLVAAATHVCRLPS
jgi:Acyl-CoA thioesterase C-terminal domain/Acyl-CoA thioesterase N-terminal domain